MRLRSNDGKILTLTGIPGGLRWMLFATVVGAAIVTVAGAFIRMQWTSSGWSFSFIPLGLGVLLGLAFLAIGALQLLARERLTLDRQIGRGDYRSNSPVVETPKPFDFRLEDVAEVRLIHRSEWRRGSSHEQTGHQAEIWRAELRIRTPRRTVVLDESQNGREQRVRPIAQTVADFLALDLAEDLGPDDERDSRSSRMGRDEAPPVDPVYADHELWTDDFSDTESED